ncbi:MAG: O-antigen ligase family protein [Planctomycetes bacterium]|nr:O-antigen ligase family protein [Planctomycetota bacterium]
MTKFGIMCDRFLEACWLAALILSPLYMNIYTHRMFEPDKGTISRSLALLMIVFYLIKVMETTKPAAQTQTPANKQKKQAEENQAKIPSKSVRSYIILPFLAFITIYIISVVFSAVPFNSLWGGYDRMQGLYTNASFWVIFILAAINIKTREQVERLISTIIFTSVPIVAYCFIQRLRLDPVPWQAMDPSIRVSATMGNPIFLSAYLIIPITLTISRFARSLYEKNLIAYIFYGVLVVLQVITVFLSQSRGPMMGMFGSIFLFILIYAWAYRKKTLLLTTIGASVFGIIFLFVFNLPHIVTFKNPPDTVGGYDMQSIKNSELQTISNTSISTMESLWHKTFGKLLNIQYFRQFGRLLETNPRSSGRTRIVLWKGVWKLINDKDEPYRFFIGWGPESLSTVYYKNYTMELARLEGANVHADRTHNHYLDVWVMHGILGLIAYLSMLAAIFYTAFRIIRSIRNVSPPTGPPDAISTGGISTDILIVIGLATAILAHLGEIFVGIAIVSTYTHFWVITATIYAIYRLSLLSQNNKKTDYSPLDTESGFHWGVYLLLGYALLTLVIAFILFQFSWPTGMLPPDMKSTRDALLTTFCIWLLAGVILGIVAWPRYLFWTYTGQTIMMAVIMVRRYWPDDSTNTDMLMIYSWLWIMAGIVVGALSLSRKERPIRIWTFSNVLVGLVISTVVFYIIANKNLSVLRADGFYKFCFSYDQSAEQAVNNGEESAKVALKEGKENEAVKIRRDKRNEAFQIRLMCIKHFQNALKFAPDERAYLNGAGRNFLELAKLAMDQGREPNANPINKLRNVPSIKDLVEGDFLKRGPDNRLYTDYTYHDFAICSFSCIQRAYELDRKNYERIIALIRIYRYLGDMERDPTKIEKALKLCDEARKASPLNDKTDDEIKQLMQRKEAFSAPPPPEQQPK